MNVLAVRWLFHTGAGATPSFLPENYGGQARQKPKVHEYL